MSTDHISDTLRQVALHEAHHAARYRSLTKDFAGYVSQSLRPIPVSRSTGLYSLPELDFGLSGWTSRGWILGTTPLEQKERRVKDTFTHFVIDSYCTPTARTYFVGRSVGYNNPDTDMLFSELRAACDRALYGVQWKRASRAKKSYGLGFNIPPLPWYDLPDGYFMDNYVSESPVFLIT